MKYALLSPADARAYLQYVLSGEKRPEPLCKITDQHVEAYWASLDSKTKALLKAKGSPCGRCANKRLIECKCKAKYKLFWDARGKAILKLMLEHGFTNPITGKPAAIAQFAIDHIVPLANGGKDEPCNMALVCHAFNSLKRDGFTYTRILELKRQAEQTQAEYETELAMLCKKKAYKLSCQEFWSKQLSFSDRQVDEIGSLIDSSSECWLRALLKTLSIGRSFSVRGRGVYGNCSTMRALAKLRLGIVPNSEQYSKLMASLDAHEGKTHWVYSYISKCK